METREQIEERLKNAWNVHAPNAGASIERNIQIEVLLDIRELLVSFLTKKE